MVMVTRSNSRRLSESFSSEISEKNIIPPWCSSRRVYERRKPRKVAPGMKSLYPLRENIWEYLNSEKPGDLDIVERKNKKRLKTTIKVKRFKSGNAKLLIFLLLALGLMVSYLTGDNISQMDLIAKILPKSNFISFLGIDTTSVGEECCQRMRHLALALRRAEQALSKAIKVRKTVLTSQNLDAVSQKTITSNKGYIEGSRAFRGSNTVEWGAQAALWGVVPVFRAAPPPDVILSLRRPIPSDCWPIRGSNGEVIIELPRNLQVDLLSLEHIRPDTAYSAPKNFTVYGILVNGTWIKAADGVYQHNKAAKQYYHLNHRNSPLQQVVFRVLSNQGNPNYTCIYRIHLYYSL